MRPGRRGSSIPSARARERRLGLRPVAGVHRRARAPDRAAPAGRRPADGAARPVARAHDRARARQRRAAGPRRPSRDAVDQLRPGREDRAAPPWRRRGPPEAGHRHLCRWHRHPVHRRHARAGRRQAPTGARRRHLDPAQGHARSRTRPPSRRPSARSREETGLEVRIVAPARLHRVLRSSMGGTRIHKTVHYFLMVPDRRRPRRATTTSSTRCAGSPSTRRRRC